MPKHAPEQNSVTLNMEAEHSYETSNKHLIPNVARTQKTILRYSVCVSCSTVFIF